MTVKEFYDLSGGGYKEMYAKFHSDAMITKFLSIFARDASYNTLLEKMDAGDADGAFAAAHTLKGVVLNLCLNGLITPVCAITEALRARDMQGATALLPKVKEEYGCAISALKKLLG